MHDFESAAWAEHRGQWTAAVGTFVRSLMVAFETLQRQRQAAPWRDQASVARPPRPLC